MLDHSMPADEPASARSTPQAASSPWGLPPGWPPSAPSEQATSPSVAATSPALSATASRRGSNASASYRTVPQAYMNQAEWAAQAIGGGQRGSRSQEDLTRRPYVGGPFMMGPSYATSPHSEADAEVVRPREDSSFGSHGRRPSRVSEQGEEPERYERRR